MKLALRRPLTPLMVALLALNAGGLAAAYKDAVNGFAVTPPPGWKQSTYPGTAVVFLTAPVDGFATNIKDRKSTRLNSSHVSESRMPSSA